MASEWRGAPRGTFELGGVPIDRVGLDEAVSAIQALVEARHGGTVVLPGAAQLLRAQRDGALREALRAASLRLANGTALVWASALCRRLLPAKVSPDALLPPLLRRAAARGWRVARFGACNVAAELEVQPVAAGDTGIGDARTEPSRAALVARLREQHVELLLISADTPHAEVLAQALRRELPTTVFVVVGTAQPRFGPLRALRFLGLVLRELHRVQVRAFAATRAARALSPGRLHPR